MGDSSALLQFVGRIPASPSMDSRVAAGSHASRSAEWPAALSPAAPRRGAAAEPGPRGAADAAQDGPHTVCHRRCVSSDGISATDSRREKEESWISRRYPSSWQGSAQWFRADADTAAVRLQASRKRKRHLNACWGGAGVQPGGTAHHWAQIPKTGLVQNSAPQTNYPWRRLQQSHHYQQVLLWPMQFFLHPQACPQRGRLFPVLFLLQAQEIYHHDCYPQLPWASAP